MSPEVQDILRLETEYYPSSMRQMQDCLNVKDLAEYAEVPVESLVLRVTSKYYIILAVHTDYVEIVDIAGSFGNSLLKEMTACLSRYKDKTICCDCRAATSYRLIKACARNRISISYENRWMWGDEEMVEVKFTVS